MTGIELDLQPAELHDLSRVTDMMRQMYAALEMRFTPGVEAAVAQMLSRPELGCIWLLLSGQSLVGYATISRWFSPELEGWTAYLDELWIDPAWRGHGIGSAAIEALVAQCRRDGLRTLRLELEDWNDGAERLYARHGFKTEARKLMTKWL